MHYTAGCDYTEADRIRRIIGKRKTKEIKTYRREFVRKAIQQGISPAESHRLFTEMELNMKYASCMAYALSAKTALDAYFLF